MFPFSRFMFVLAAYLKIPVTVTRPTSRRSEPPPPYPRSPVPYCNHPGLRRATTPCTFPRFHSFVLPYNIQVPIPRYFAGLLLLSCLRGMCARLVFVSIRCSRTATCTLQVRSQV